MTMAFLLARPQGRIRVTVLGVGLLICALLSPLAQAQQAAAGIEPFTGAEVAYSTTGREVRHYSVPVDRISRVDGFMQPRTTREVSGRLSSVTWRHPRGVTSEAVFAHLRAQLRGEPWYECQSRDCGPSTYWAHRQFEIAALYGGDATQFYVAVPRATAAGPVLTMLYVVQRGTREVLAHVVEVLLEQTDAAASAPDGLAQTLAAAGVVRLPMVFTAEGEADGDIEPLLEELGRAGASLPASSELWLVVHLRDRGRGSEATLAESRDRATRLAARLAAVLPERTVAGYGVGALIPGVLGDEDAVVQIVVQQAAD